MKNYHNIEKSGFHHGQYVGYSNGKVYRITKCNTSYGNWCAKNRDDYNDQMFAFGLTNLSKQLENKAIKQ